MNRTYIVTDRFGLRKEPTVLENTIPVFAEYFQLQITKCHYKHIPVRVYISCYSNWKYIPNRSLVTEIGSNQETMRCVSRV